MDNRSHTANRNYLLVAPVLNRIPPSQAHLESMDTITTPVNKSQQTQHLIPLLASQIQLTIGNNASRVNSSPMTLPRHHLIHQ